MGTQTTERRASPPYLPFKTFLNFLDLLAKTIVPQRIDSSVMSKYPGSIKAQLRAALGYIGAIDDQGVVAPWFRELVKARGTDEWRETFGEYFFRWYRDLLGDLEIESATMAQLKDRFKEAGAEGSVIIKATRFFLAGLDEIGAIYSPHLKLRGALTGGMSSPRPKKRPARSRLDVEDPDIADMDDDDDVAEPGVPEGFQRLALPVKSGGQAVFVLPSDMTRKDWRMMTAYIEMYYEFAPDHEL